MADMTTTTATKTEHFNVGGTRTHNEDEDDDEDVEDGCGVACTFHVSVSADKKAYLEVFQSLHRVSRLWHCLGDYRNAHCLNCGNHYFYGIRDSHARRGAVNTWGLIGGQRLTLGPARLQLPQLGSASKEILTRSTRRRQPPAARPG